MTLPTISTLPDAPSRASDTAAQFSSKADALVAALDTFVTELNTFGSTLYSEAQSQIAGVGSINGEVGVVTGYSKQAGVETLTNKTIDDGAFTGSVTEQVFTITDGASVDINPANGTIQQWTLGANRTPTATMSSGQYVMLYIDDGSAYAVTWTTIGVVWAGGSAPTLPTSGFGSILLMKVGSVIRGFYCGAVAS